MQESLPARHTTCLPAPLPRTSVHGTHQLGIYRRTAGCAARKTVLACRLARCCMECEVQARFKFWLVPGLGKLAWIGPRMQAWPLCTREQWQPAGTHKPSKSTSKTFYCFLT